MMKTFILGTTAEGNTVYLGKSENSHILSIGRSGVGKSTTMTRYMEEAAYMGRRVIQIKWRNSVADESEQNTVIPMRVKRIRAAYEPIQIPLFKPVENADGSIEPQILMVDRIASLLSKSANLSDAQTRKVKQAVASVAEGDFYDQDGISAIKCFLDSEGNSAVKASEKLSPFFTTNLLKNGDFLNSDAEVIVIDIDDFQLDQQVIIVEFLLRWIFFYGSKGGFKQRGIVVYIDEAQNLSYTPDSPMYLLLNESRKFNIAVFMAAPSLKAGGKRGMNIATMCGTTLYFKPLSADIDDIAGLIDPIFRADCAEALKHLPVGQCMVTGNLIIDGEIVSSPIRLVNTGCDRSVKENTNGTSKQNTKRLC